MKFFMQFLAIGFLILCSTASAWYAARGHQEDNRGLMADRYVHDFGDMWQGTSSETTFVLENRSNKHLSIIRHVSGCSCTGTTIDRPELESGDTAHLNVQFNAGTTRGDVGAPIVIFYRIDGDPTLSQLVFKLKAFLRSDYEVSPSDLLSFRRGEASTETIRVVSDREDFRIVEVYCSHPAFSVKLDNDGGDEISRSTPRIDLSFDPSQWVDDSIKPTLTMVTNSDHQRTYDLTVSVESMRSVLIKGDKL